MKKTLLLTFSIFHLFALSALAIDDDAVIDWGAPIVEAGRTGCVYSVKYTKTDPTATGSWTQRSFDDSNWTDGFGPIANTGFGGVLGTTFDDVNDGEYNVWFRRTFTLEESFYDKDIWLACGHDDEGAIYIDGMKIVSWGNEWDFARFQKLTDAQKALLTEGEHVMAVWAKNNSGGFYYDCGLYGIEGDEPQDHPVAEVSVDFSTWEEHPLVKKFGVYQTPWVRGTELNRDLPKLAELEARSMRYEMCWGNDYAYAEPSISGTATGWRYNFRTYDNMYKKMRQNTQTLITSHGYCPSIINGGDNRNVPSDWNVWAKVNSDWAAPLEGAESGQPVHRGLERT